MGIFVKCDTCDAEFWAGTHPDTPERIQNKVTTKCPNCGGTLETFARRAARKK